MTFISAVLGIVAGWLLLSQKAGADINDGDAGMTDNEINFNVPDTRGFRNNNPGNIEFSERNNWKGQTGTDGRYATFSDMKFGIRAIGRTLNSYANRHGLKTIRGIITRWAPDFENNTKSYISAVSQRTGLDPDRELSGSDHLLVVEAIIHHENGSQPFPLSYISEAMAIG